MRKSTLSPQCAHLAEGGLLPAAQPRQRRSQLRQRGSRLAAVSETGITAHLCARVLACRTAGRRARSKCNAAAVYAASKREDLRCQTSG
jgi:hypothetical protein